MTIKSKQSLLDSLEQMSATELRRVLAECVLNANAGVVADGAQLLLEVPHGQQRQRFELGALLFEHDPHLAPFGAVDAGGRPFAFTT